MTRRGTRHVGRANRKNMDGLLGAAAEGFSAKAGPGAGVHLKELKVGPLKIGGGVVFGSGGIGYDSEGLNVWGNSTADIQLSVGKYGGRAYIWDVNLDSASGINNVDVFGAVKPDWDWSIGIGGTVSPYSFEINYDFQPIIDYFNN
jgi:hypothetical protein